MAALSDVEGLDISREAKSALVAAGLHNLAYRSNRYPWQILSLDEPGEIQSSYTIGIDQPDRMQDEIRSCPYPIIKVKMGFDEDEMLIDTLENISGKVFRVDANGGWAPEKAEKMIALLNKIGVQLVEQPTGIEYMAEWPYLKKKNRLPIFADEGLNTEDDYYQSAEKIDGVNIKMAKSGGILEAIKIARAARKDKKQVMLGCMVETSIGISQAVYMSSLADYFDLDGPLLLKCDPARGINYHYERISISGMPISGPVLKEEYL